MSKQTTRTSKIATIGELNRHVQLMRLETVGINPNTYQPIKKNVVFANIWAKVSALHGQEYYTAVSVQLEKQLSFIIRYRPDITEQVNIWFEGRGYNISFIDDVKYHHEFMEIKANYSKRVRKPDED